MGVGGPGPPILTPIPLLALMTAACLFLVHGGARPLQPRQRAGQLLMTNTPPLVSTHPFGITSTHLSPPPVTMALPDRAGAVMVANNSLTSYGGTAWPGW